MASSLRGRTAPRHQCADVDETVYEASVLGFLCSSAAWVQGEPGRARGLPAAGAEVKATAGLEVPARVGPPHISHRGVGFNGAVRLTRLIDPPRLILIGVHPRRVAIGIVA